MTLPYSSPNEERAKPKREDSGTYYRDRRRSPAAQECAELMRRLSALAGDYPSYKTDIQKLRHRVSVRLRSPGRKRKMVLACLGSMPTTSEEIAEQTGLDQQSIDETLRLLATWQEAETCDRDGKPIVMRRNDRPTRSVHWRIPARHPRTSAETARAPS